MEGHHHHDEEGHHDEDGAIERSKNPWNQKYLDPTTTDLPE